MVTRAVSSIAALGILSAFGGVAPPGRREFVPTVWGSHGNGGRALRRRRVRNRIAGRSRAANRGK